MHSIEYIYIERKSEKEREGERERKREREREREILYDCFIVVLVLDVLVYLLLYILC